MALPLLYSCGKNTDGNEAVCTVTQQEDGSLITCPDGTSSFIPNGNNGQDGMSVVFTVIPDLSCKNGSIILMAYDADRNGQLDVSSDLNVQSMKVCSGNIGAKGDKGDKGDQGTDGVNGTNGTNANNDFTPVSIIDPCGRQSPADEILLKLGNGTILASFSDNTSGKNTRFTVLQSGSYVTTDGTNCYFTITVDNHITNEHY